MLITIMYKYQCIIFGYLSYISEGDEKVKNWILSGMTIGDFFFPVVLEVQIGRR